VEEAIMNAEAKRISGLIEAIKCYRGEGCPLGSPARTIQVTTIEATLQETLPRRTIEREIQGLSIAEIAPPLLGLESR